MSMNAVDVGDKRLAVLVHLNGMERVIPLAGGYLKAYAFAEPELEARWDIQLYSVFVEAISASRLITDIYEAQPDLVGFSVYVWNAGLVRRVLPALRLLLPQATFILGGTEVLNRSADFIDPGWENVLVCNGEGEKTFRDLLGVLLGEPLGFDQIGGVSYFQGGELKTTKPYARIKSLDEVPSPYLKGYFDKRDYSVALLETNRGCPYQCEFCFWGGATGQKITRTSYDRLHAEIELLGQNKARRHARSISAMPISEYSRRMSNWRANSCAPRMSADFPITSATARPRTIRNGPLKLPRRWLMAACCPCSRSRFRA
ncbi:hypothetical protein BMJ31_19865 [Sinorhizobium medicae]|nr:hypothetical protein BMJ31_19865 [Sinorhizobium medicae]